MGVTTVLGLVSGSSNRQSKLSLQSYLQLVHDDLLSCRDGVAVFDASRRETFACKVRGNACDSGSGGLTSFVAVPGACAWPGHHLRDAHALRTPC